MHKILPKENIHLYQADMDKEYENTYFWKDICIYSYMPNIVQSRDSMEDSLREKASFCR